MNIDKKIQKHFKKYKTTTARHLARSILKSVGEDLYISVNALRRECGQLRLSGNRQWVYDLFKDEVPFFHIITKGSNLTRKLSLIRLDQGNLSDILDEIEAQERNVIFDVQYQGMTQEEVKALPRIPVDCRSLENYIVSTRSQLENPKKKAQRPAMQRYLGEAEKLQKLMNALEASGISGLPYIQKRHDFGRYYQKGINLQSIPKVVRHAALGKCYEYDLNSAVVSIKLLLTDQLVRDAGGDYRKLHWHSKELVLEKKQLTRRLADLMTVDHPDKPSLIKKLLNALVFGAPLSERAWKAPHGYKFGSFTDIIKKPEDREALVNDGWLAAFAQEQKEQNNFIVKNFYDPILARIDNARLKTPSGRLRKNVAMVLIYQHVETNLMKSVIEAFSDKVILHVHDAVYTSKPLNRQKLEGVVESFLIDFGIRPTELFMDLRFSRTDYKAYSKNPYVLESEIDKIVKSFDKTARRVSHKQIKTSQIIS